MRPGNDERNVFPRPNVNVTAPTNNKRHSVGRDESKLTVLNIAEAEFMKLVHK